MKKNNNNNNNYNNNIYLDPKNINDEDFYPSSVSEKNSKSKYFDSSKKKFNEKENLYKIKAIKLNDSNPSNSFLNSENISFLLLNHNHFIEIFDANKSSKIKYFKKISESLNELNYEEELKKENWNYNSIIKKTNIINENYFKFLISKISEKEEKIEKIISIIKQKNQNFLELKNEVEKLETKKNQMEHKIKNFKFLKKFLKNFEDLFNFFLLKFYSSNFLSLEFNKLKILFHKKMILSFEFVEFDYLSFYNNENFENFFENFYKNYNDYNNKDKDNINYNKDNSNSYSNSFDENINLKNNYNNLRNLFDLIIFSIKNTLNNNNSHNDFKNHSQTNNINNFNVLSNPKLLLKNITFKFNEDCLFKETINNNNKKDKDKDKDKEDKDSKISNIFNKIFIYILNELFTDKNKKFYEINFLQFLKHYKELTKIGVSILFIKNELNFFYELFDDINIEFNENEEIIILDFLILKSNMKINLNFNVSIFDCFYEFYFSDFYLENLSIPEKEYEDIKSNYENLSKQIKELLNQRYNFPHPFFFRNFITNIRNVIISDNFN
jgi:hypothetical protein